MSAHTECPIGYSEYTYNKPFLTKMVWFGTSDTFVPLGSTTGVNVYPDNTSMSPHQRCDYLHNRHSVGGYDIRSMLWVITSVKLIAILSSA